MEHSTSPSSAEENWCVLPVRHTLRAIEVPTGLDIDRVHQLPQPTKAAAVEMEQESCPLGVAFLPDHVCAQHIASGRLVHLLPDWRGREGIVHLVFTTRRGLPPAVRALIDQLARSFPSL